MSGKNKGFEELNQLVGTILFEIVKNAQQETTKDKQEGLNKKKLFTNPTTSSLEDKNKAENSQTTTIHVGKSYRDNVAQDSKSNTIYIGKSYTENNKNNDHRNKVTTATPTNFKAKL